MTNCLFYALALYFRRYKRKVRQYILVRKSDAGPFPHFLYMEFRNGKNRVISYKPNNPIQRKIPPIIFHGSVKWGD